MNVLYCILIAFPFLPSGVLLAYIINDVFGFELKHSRAVKISILILGLIGGILAFFAYLAGRSKGLGVSPGTGPGLVLEIYMAVCGFIIFFSLREKWWRRFIITGTVSSILSNINTMFNMLGEILRPEMSKEPVMTIVSAIITDALTLGLEVLFFMILKKLRVRHNSPKPPMPLLFILAISLSLVSEISFGALYGDSNTMSDILKPVFILILVITLVAVVLFFYIRSARQERSDLIEINKTNEQLIMAQTKYFENSANADREIRAMRHDMKNNLQVLALLLESGKTDEMRSYLEELGENLSSADIVYHTGSSIADAIISEKRSEALEKGITLNVSGVISGIDMTPVDTCKILANLLDNSIEAYSSPELSDLDEKHRTIDLSFRKTENFFMISCSNKCAPSLLSGADSFRTRDQERFTAKRDKINHGLGLYNIRNAAENYSGEVEIDIRSDGHFTVFCTDIVFTLQPS